MNNNSNVAAVFDLEGNGLWETVSTIHCLVIKDYISGHKYKYRPTEIYNAVDHLNTYGLIIAHNGIDYDIPVIEKITGKKIIPQCLDTIVTSRLLFPDRLGGHSLEAWGKRLKIFKGSLTDDDDESPEKVWEVYTEEMLDYCDQDTEVCYALCKYLLTEMGLTLEDIINNNLLRPAGVQFNPSHHR